MDPRIKVAFARPTATSARRPTRPLDLATGEFVALFDHDDVLSPTALYEVAAEIDAHPDAQFIYSDEDKIDVEDRRFDPYFKPDWNPDLNHGQNYTSHLSVYRTDLIRSLGGFRKGYEGSQDWDLSCARSRGSPRRRYGTFPKLLYHWRAVPGSTALQLAEKSYPSRRPAGPRGPLRRRGETVELLPVPGDHWRIKYPVPSPAPFVSLIIPTRNALKLVRQAVRSILATTDYPSYEIVIVDNGRTTRDPRLSCAGLEGGPAGPRHALPRAVQLLRDQQPRRARGPWRVVGLLNNDVEAIDRDWLTEMVSQAVRPGIGAVGAMLYYP
jgi:hypothetical protein